MTSKYGNRKTEVDGITFDSAKEARRYQELKLLLEAGRIRGLALQPSYTLLPKFTHNGKTERAVVYRADFAYMDMDTHRLTVEDVKGVRTEIYKLKRKLFLHQNPNIVFLET